MGTTEKSVRAMVANYKELIEAFISGNISAGAFEGDYIRIFTNDKNQVSGPEFNSIENLFFAVDDYVEDPTLREAVSGIGPDELRKCAQETFDALYG